MKNADDIDGKESSVVKTSKGLKRYKNISFNDEVV